MARGPNPGDPAPPFALPLVDGHRYRLEDFAGRPLTLVFLRHLA